MVVDLIHSCMLACSTDNEYKKEPEKPKVKVEQSSFESDTVKTTVGKGSVVSLFAKQTQKSMLLCYVVVDLIHSGVSACSTDSENRKEPEKPKVKVEPSASFESDTVKTTVVHM